MGIAVTALEEVLLEIGNRLLTPPPSVDELLILLDQAEALLSRVEQSPSQSMSAALSPAMKGLTSKELLGHSVVDVKVAVASCISEITRITAPEAPYDDDLMKEIFQLIVESFEKLDDVQNRSFAKRVLILETVAKVRSCVVMLDLECDALILEMFHHFLKTIRDSHPGNVFSSMEMIMTVVLEESEDISPDLLSCLLSSVKKDSKDTLQITRRLAEKVIHNCASKLKPSLLEAVQSLGSPVDDYSEIVALVCQEHSDQLVHGGLNSGECLADDSKLSVRTVSDEPPKGSGKLESVACSEQVGNATDKSPKSVMGNGAVKTENGDSSVEPTLPNEEIKHSGLGILAEHTTLTGLETDKVDAAVDDGMKEAGGHKGNYVIRSSETTNPSRIDSDKEAVESIPRSEGGSKEIDNLQSEGIADKEAEAILSEACAKVIELQNSPEKSPDDYAPITSSAPSEKLPDTVGPKRGRPSGSKVSSKKGRKTADVRVTPSGTVKSVEKEHTSNEEVSPMDKSTKEQNEGTSDVEPKAPGHSVKKGPPESVDNGGNLSTDSPSKMDLDVATDSEEKLHRRPGRKPQMQKSSDGGISGKRQVSKTKQQKGIASSENNVAGEPILKEKNSSLKMDAKAEQNEQVEETPKMKSLKKCAQEKEISETPRAALKYDESLVGAKIKVWWPDDERFYSGVIYSYDPASMRHKVLYADGDEEDLLLKDEIFQFLKGDEEEDEDQGDSANVAASEMSRKKAKTSNSSSKKLKVITSSKRGRGSSTGKDRGVGADPAGRQRKGSNSTSGNKTGDITPTGGRSKERAGDITPTGGRSKERAANRSSLGSPKAGSASKDESSKKSMGASPKTTTKSKDGVPKSAPKTKDDVARSDTKSKDDAKNSSKSSKDAKSKSGQRVKDSSTTKGGRGDSNGMLKGKTGLSKGHGDEVAASDIGISQESEEKSGKKRRRTCGWCGQTICFNSMF